MAVRHAVEMGGKIYKMALLTGTLVLGVTCAYLGVVTIFDSFGWWAGPPYHQGLLGEYLPAVAGFLTDYDLPFPWCLRIAGAGLLYVALLLGSWTDKQRRS